MFVPEGMTAFEVTDSSDPDAAAFRYGELEIYFIHNPWDSAMTLDEMRAFSETIEGVGHAECAQINGIPCVYYEWTGYVPGRENETYKDMTLMIPEDGENWIRVSASPITDGDTETRARLVLFSLLRSE